MAQVKDSYLPHAPIPPTHSIGHARRVCSQQVQPLWSLTQLLLNTIPEVWVCSLGLVRLCSYCYLHISRTEINCVKDNIFARFGVLCVPTTLCKALVAIFLTVHPSRTDA